MKITIIYDNKTWEEGLKADWGFYCIVDAYDKKIFFDTGTNGSILLHNMQRLNIDPIDDGVRLHIFTKNIYC